MVHRGGHEGSWHLVLSIRNAANWDERMVEGRDRGGFLSSGQVAEAIASAKARMRRCYKQPGTMRRLVHLSQTSYQDLKLTSKWPGAIYNGKKVCQGISVWGRNDEGPVKVGTYATVGSPH